MEFITKSKAWFLKTLRTLTTTILLCFQNCRQKFSNRSQQRQRRHLRKGNNLSTTENSLKLHLDDGGSPQLPGTSHLDRQFDLGRKRPGDSSNSTTSTEETASDDSLLGSPNRGRQVELTLRGHDPGWIGDDGSVILQVIDECKSAVVDPSASTPLSLTSQTCCSTCHLDQSTISDMISCDQLRKMNGDLLEKLDEGNQRIESLEKQLLEMHSTVRQQYQSHGILSKVNDFQAIIDQSRMDEELEENSNTDLTMDGHSSTMVLENVANSTATYSSVLASSSASPPHAPAPPPPPPPPPLPLPGHTWDRASSKGRRKSVPTPSCQLKTLNWIKLKEDTLTGTVWDGLDDEGLYSILDLKEIEKHFSCASNYDPFGTIRSRLSVCSMIREISVLDARRAQNCAILLNKLKLSDREIKAAVLSFDSADRIPRDMAEQLLKFIPTKEELALLAPYHSSVEVLHPADRFFVEISTIKRYEQRLRCLCFKKQFKETIEETSKDIATITSASRRILASKRLRKLLAAILAIGNYLNQSKRSSDASGFHLSVLTMLQDVKSSLGTDYTLMHYLVEFCHKSMPDVFGLLQETAVSMEAAKISGPDMQTDVNKLREGLKLLSSELKEAATSTGNNNNNGEEQDSFAIVAGSLLAEYKASFSTLDNSFNEMRNAFAACCKAYAPEEHYPETLSVSDFFGYFGQFLNQFTIVETQLTRRKHEQEMRNLTLTRAKTKRQSTLGGTNAQTQNQLPSFARRSRRSGRISKKAVTDVNEELLTSVLLAMDQRRGGASAARQGINEIIISGPRQRRSFRLSVKRKQLKASSNPNGAVIRRKISGQVAATCIPIEAEPSRVEVGMEMEEVNAGHDSCKGDSSFDGNANRRQRNKHSDGLCRDR